MSGKEALFKMIDLINTVIHALNDINADESNCVLNDLPKTEGGTPDGIIIQRQML